MMFCFSAARVTPLATAFRCLSYRDSAIVSSFLGIWVDRLLFGDVMGRMADFVIQWF